MVRHASLVLLAAWVSIAAGCSPEGEPERPSPRDFDSIEAEPFRGTAVLGEESARLLESATPDGRVRFERAPPELAEAKPGTVFVVGRSEAAPAGLLRVVRAVSRDGDALILDTLPAMPQLAYRRLRVTSRRSGVELDMASFELDQRLVAEGADALQSPLGSRTSIDTLIFDGDGDGATKDDQIRLVGHVEGRIDFSVDMEFDWGALDDLPGAVTDCLASLVDVAALQLPACTPLELLPEMKADFRATPRGLLDVGVEGAAALSFGDDFTLGTIPLPPIPLGPVVVAPVLEIRAGVAGEASARFTTGLEAELAVSTGATASTRDGIVPRPPEITDFHVREKPTELALFASGRVHLGVRLTLALWGIVGPYAEVRGYGELSADSTREPCYALVAGLEALFGLKVSTPVLPVVGAVTFFDYESEPLVIAGEELASGSCTFPPGTRMRGAGPDAETLANPSAALWQKTVVDDFEAPMVAGVPSRSMLGRVELARTIDGRMIALAAPSKVISKLDGDGSVRWTKVLPQVVADVASGRNGTFRLLSNDFDGGDFMLIELDQQGNRGRTWKYRLPAELACSGPALERVHGMANGDFAVALHCYGGPALVVRVAADGRVRGAVALSGDGAALEPTALLAKGDDLLVAGALTPGAIAGDLFLARLDERLDLRWAKRYPDCEETRGFVPSQMRSTFERDELVVVGGTGLGGGFFVRLTPDGEVAFASFPWLGIGVTAHFLANDVVELPQTGYLLTGSGVRLGDEDEAMSRGAARLVHLDGAGRPRATTRYGSPDGHSGYPGIVLGDDGGFVLAAVEQAQASAPGRLLALGGWAKDGHTEGTLFAAATEPVLEEAACSLAAQPAAVEAAPIRVVGFLAP